MHAAISRSKAIHQMIAVTHSEAFAEKAEQVIRVDKEADACIVSVEKWSLLFLFLGFLFVLRRSLD